ncbi:MAG: dUTP diphosphatase [Clostridia bacterium]|nr:dUTP diphosphatase [Clostridia bacterium]
MSEIQFKKIDPAAVIPQRATAGSAGLDLRACLTEPVTLKKGEHALIPTGLAVKVEDGFAAMLFARSGLAIKHGIGLLNGVGVVDSDYRGEIRVGVINQFEETYTIEPNERIAQMVVMPVSLAPVIEVDELDETDRGAGGFGSTGR